MSNIGLSICVTTYNRWSSVVLTLNSLIKSSNPFVEIIIVDDCSSSPAPRDFMDLINKYSIRYIRHSKNKGLAAARNTAIQAAKGTYFSFCDDDDIWDPDAIKSIFALIENERHKPEMLIAQKNDVVKKIYHQTFQNLEDLFLLGVTPPVGSQVYLLSLIRSVGGYREEIKSGVDHDLWIRIARKKNVKVHIFSGIIAIPNTSNDLERMTLNVNKRLDGINKSLEILKNDLIKIFGTEFFRHFVKEYRYHIRKKFLISAIKRKDYKYILSNIFFIVLEFRIMRHFLEHIGAVKRISSFRKYKGSLNG